jgi:hypothetical protein
VGVPSSRHLPCHSFFQRAPAIMLRRDARLRREYLHRKGLEGQEREVYNKKRKVKEALESGKPIPTELRKEGRELKAQIQLDDARTSGQQPDSAMRRLRCRLLRFSVQRHEFLGVPHSATRLRAADRDVCRCFHCVVVCFCYLSCCCSPFLLAHSRRVEDAHR